MIVAHPHYLKVRVLGSNEPYPYDWEAFCPVALGPEILQDLSALYADVPTREHAAESSCPCH